MNSRLCSLVFDQSAIERKIEELTEALQVTFSEGIPSNVIDDLKGLLSNVLVSYRSTAVDADGTDKILVSLDFGDGFERLIAALRAGKANGAVRHAQEYRTPTKHRQ